MNEGINLASRPMGSPRLGIALAWLSILGALAVTSIHLAHAVRANRTVLELREEMVRMELRGDTLARQIGQSQEHLATPPALNIIRRLTAIERSGAALAVNPPEVLAELANLMPLDARALSVRLESAPPDPELGMEVLAESPRAAAELLARLSQSRYVMEAEILEERHQQDGEIYLRIAAALTKPGAETGVEK